MIGMHSATGQPVSGLAHLRQSIADILTTPVGSRVMRREYGSLIPELIDAPFNAATRQRLYAAAVTALIRWEPRLRISRVQLSDATYQGAAELEITGVAVDNNEALNLRVPLSLGAMA